MCGPGGPPAIAGMSQLSRIDEQARVGHELAVDGPNDEPDRAPALKLARKRPPSAGKLVAHGEWVGELASNWLGHVERESVSVFGHELTDERALGTHQDGLGTNARKRLGALCTTQRRRDSKGDRQDGNRQGNAHDATVTAETRRRLRPDASPQEAKGSARCRAPSASCTSSIGDTGADALVGSRSIARAGEQSANGTVSQAVVELCHLTRAPCRLTCARQRSRSRKPAHESGATRRRAYRRPTSA